MCDLHSYDTQTPSPAPQTHKLSINLSTSSGTCDVGGFRVEGLGFRVKGLGFRV